jgi:hypothetical protein
MRALYVVRRGSHSASLSQVAQKMLEFQMKQLVLAEILSLIVGV